MTFSNMWPLGFLILIPVIILLYLLKQKVKDQPFSSTMLWREIYKNLEARTPFEKLKQNILMYLQIIAMLLLILALMAPVIRNGGLVQRNTILVIDNSASMETTYNGGKSRLDEAVLRAKNYLDGVNDSGMITIVSCDDEAEILYQGQDKSIAKKRLNALTTETVSGNLDVASGLVGSLISNLENVDVVCYTDSEFDYGSLKRNNEKISLSVESIYSKEENLSVDYINYGLKEVNDGSDGTGSSNTVVEAICKVTNHGTKQMSSDVSLYMNNEIKDVQTVTIEPGESENVYFSEVELPGDYLSNNLLSSGYSSNESSSNDSSSEDYLRSSGVILRAELSEKDSLTADNISSIQVTSGNGKKVLLLSEGNVFMEKALYLADGSEVYKSDSVSVLDQDNDFDLYVFDGINIPDDFDVSKIKKDAAIMFIGYEKDPLGIGYINEGSSVTDTMLYFEKSDITEYVENYSFGVTNAFVYDLPYWAHAVIVTDDGGTVGYYGSVSNDGNVYGNYSSTEKDGSVAKDGGIAKDGGVAKDGGIAKDGGGAKDGIAAKDGSAAKDGIAAKGGGAAKDGSAAKGGGASKNGSAAGNNGSSSENGLRRIAVLGFDIHNTDLALQTEFPIFMSQLTEYLLTGNEALIEINNFPIDESEVIPIDNVSVEGILDKTKTGGRAIRNILLAIAIVILIIEWIIYHFQVHSGKKKQFLAVRMILLALIILAIFGVSVTKKQSKVETIFLVDVSDSMSGNLTEVEKYLKDTIGLMPKKNQAGVVLFGKNTAVEQFMSDRKDFYGLTAQPVTTATNIESGVTSACSMFHDGVTKRLVLITDGCENEGSVSLAASNMKRSDVELLVIEMPDSVSGSSEVYIDGLETPSVIHAGDHYNITVSVKSNVETDALLSLYSGRISKGQKEIHLTKGNNQFVFEDVGEEGTIAQYKAVIEPDKDTLAINNTYVTFSQIEAQPKVLLVEGKTDNTKEFEKILTAANIGYDVASPNSVPVSLSQLNTYKAVITVDVHYDDLRDGFAKTLEAYVKDYSGGYICIGGDNSFALGGYRDTELEEILPVDMDLQGEKEIPKMAMVMVIDQSGSMAAPAEDNVSVTCLDLAKQAAIAGVKELRDTDEAGVLAFDDSYNWTVPIKKVDDTEDITEKIRTIGDGGGTSIYPAVEEAYAKILKSDAKVKHIILLTDGQDEFREYDPLLGRINDAGITVSTVAVGSDADTKLLHTIADNCGGRYYYTDINNSIPRIFAKEVYLSTNNYLINEEFYPVITSNNEILTGVMDEGCPALLGYIAARAKPRADVILESPSGDPILTTWQCGLGRTASWNSDGTNEWTAAYGTWDNYPLLWSNIIYYVISDTDLGSDDLEIVKEGNSAKIIYDTDEYDKNTVVTAVVADENGETKEVTLDPMKPGSFEADIASDEIGIYNLSIRKKNGEEIVKNYNTAYANQYSPEYKFTDSNGELARFIKQADGSPITLDDDVWNTEARKVSSKVPLTMPLIILSMGLLLFDIIIRRFSLDVAGGIRDAFVSGAGKIKGIASSGKGKNKAAKKKTARKKTDDENNTNGNEQLSESDNVNKDSGKNNIEDNSKNHKKNKNNDDDSGKNNIEDNRKKHKKNNNNNEDNNKNNNKNTGNNKGKGDSNGKNGASEKLDMNTLLQKKKDRS